MRVRSCLFLAVLGLAAVPSAARPADNDTTATPAVVIRVVSLDGVLADLKYLADLAGQPGDAKRIDDRIKKTFPKGFPGIDTKRPLGVYGTLDPAGNLMDISGAIMLPVNDEKAFLGLLQDYNLKPEKGDDGIYTLEREEGQVLVYLRFAHKYAYLTIKNRSSLATAQLLPPARVFANNTAETVGASFRIDQVPKTFRDLALNRVETRLTDEEEQKPAGETAAQHALRVQASREVTRQLAALLQQGGEVTVRLHVDRQAQALAAEATLAGKPGSDLSQHIAALGATQSLFGDLAGADSAMSGLVHLSLPPAVRKALVPVIDDGIRAALQKEKDADKRARTEKALKSLAPTLKAGELDAAVDLRRSAGHKHYTLVAGVKVQGGTALEQALRDLLKELPSEARGHIKLDAESAGEVKIHRVEVQKELDAEARRNFGENPFYVAVRSDALMVAGGEGGLEALKSALSAKAAPAPAVRLELSMARLAAVMGKTKQGGDPKAVAQSVFGGGGKNNDKVRLTVEGGKVLRFRLDLKGPVIKFFRQVDQQGPAARDRS